MNTKIKTSEQLSKIVSNIKKEGKKVVFTNGCFDIIHIGHTRYLAQAKELGDVLVVAVNDDTSVKHLKGEQRPIITEEERAEILASLEVVDFVTIFRELTPYNVISKLQPDILVKGGDWTKDTIVGKDIVESYGGKVLTIPLVNSISTSTILKRILEQSPNTCQF
ncbi:MAG: D-glycero-beta-D-manno-heptose 1-phosphate adenylyltransferase [Thermodesulfobacteriota bacterium]|nr:D-glycero-beta-D-manno-heptose 1-phosphate adenylyltransferase [Thermodesulfobacteriota bacterium]